MDILCKFEKIENENEVQRISYNKSQIWPFLRVYLSYSIFGKGKIATKSLNILKTFKNVFYGFFNYRLNVDYIFFTDTADRKYINNKYYDRIDFLSEKYNNKIVFELTTTDYYKRNDIPTKNIVSKLPLYILARIIRLFVNLKKIENINIIQNIIEKNNFDFDTDSYLKDYISHYKVGKILIKFFRPKALILAPSYTNFPYIDAFKSKGLIVIELQHGLINNKHLAYNFNIEIENNLFPDYLFTYGEFEKSIFNSKNSFINKQNVIPTGHFYINFIKNNYKPNIELSRLLKEYDLSIAVTLQPNFEQKLLDFIFNVASENKNVAFVIIPRNPIEIDFKEDNVFLNTKIDCYQTVLNTDIHCTIYSSCAVEAIGLHKANILIDIDNKSNEYLSFLFDIKNNYFVKNEKEFNTVIKKENFSIKSDVSSKFFNGDFSKTLNKNFDKIFDL